MSKRILLVVTNVDHYDADPSHPTGLWLSELTHAYDIFEKHGFEQTIVEPGGWALAAGAAVAEVPQLRQLPAKAWHTDPARMALLEPRRC